MKTIKPVEQANDAQLRSLAERYAYDADHRKIVHSTLPLLTSERSHLINLLKHNHVSNFAH